MDIKEIIKHVGERGEEWVEQRRSEKAEGKDRKEAERKETERQRKLQEKLENQARIKQLQDEAVEFGISFTDYLAFLTCKHMEEVEYKLDSLEDDVSGLERNVADLEKRM